MSIDHGMDKEDVVHIGREYDSHRKEQDWVPFAAKDANRDYHT